MNKIRNFLNYFARILGVSVALGIVILLVGMGIFFMITEQTNVVLDVLPYSVLVAAMSFVGGTTFLDYYGMDNKKALIGGGLVAIIVLFLIISIAEGVVFLIENDITGEKFSIIIFAFSFCIIISTIILWIFKSRLNK